MKDRETFELLSGIENIIRQAGEIMVHAHLNRSEIISKAGQRGISVAAMQIEFG